MKQPADMKKVGLFIDTWYPMVDGVIKVVDNYARRLMQYCDVVVFCPATRGYSKAEDNKLPYKVVRCSSFPLINNDYDIPMSALDPKFNAQLMRSGIDFVHIHSPFTVGLAGVLYAKMHKLPVVATLHSQYKQDFEKPLGNFKPAVNVALNTIMSVFNQCDECWAVNEGIKELYQKEYGLTAPCKVRLNGTDHHPVADPQEAARIVNETYHISADTTVFLFVGRINFIKNIDFTVRSLARAKKLGLKNFRMLFVGKGQDEKKLAELDKEQGLIDEVVMCGLVSDKTMLENLYSRAKLFLFPSLYDANSLVQIEAACQSTPTLFLEGARTAATVKAGVNGYVSPAGEDNYAQAIMDILADAEGYERVAKAAHNDLYINWDDVVKEVYKDYGILKANKTAKGKPTGKDYVGSDALYTDVQRTVQLVAEMNTGRSSLVVRQNNQRNQHKSIKMKKVTIISTSLRPGSNSNMLAEQFAAGAKAAGNEVEFISLRDKEIKFCIGCLSCQKTGACVIKDDVPAIMDSVLNADVVCWATPIYYYEMSGQMKTLIDRMNAMYSKNYRFREVYLLTTAAENEDFTPKRTESGLMGWIECYEKSELKGHLFCGDVGGPKEIEGNAKLQEAYEMGKNI